MTYKYFTKNRFKCKIPYSIDQSFIFTKLKTFRQLVFMITFRLGLVKAIYYLFSTGTVERENQ